MKATIIIPAYNEASVIGEVISKLKSEVSRLGGFEILVIDDGSSDNTLQEAKKAGAVVIRHPINRGLGGALGTGLIYAKNNQIQLAVTFDADGQHDAKDIKDIIKPIIKGKADVVIGSRTLRKNAIPLDRKLMIHLSNLLTNIFYGVKTGDSQSGMRAFSKKALKKLKVRTQGMEVSTEIFSEIRTHNLRLIEVPINVVYTKYSRKKGQSNLNALSILARLLLRIAR